MPVSYDSKQIIPAPFVSITKTYDRNEIGKKIGASYVLTVSGTLVANQGSPASVAGSAPDWDENFWVASGYPDCENIDYDARLAAILRKQEALRCLFADDGKVFEIHPLDGSAPLMCNPKVINISFAEGLWVERCDYTITLEAERLYGNAMCTPDDEGDLDPFVSNQSEEWSIEFNDVPQNASVHHTFRVSHSVSATGKLAYEADGSLAYQPWEYAKQWVDSKLGYDATKAQDGNIGVPVSYSAYNHVRSENLNEDSGTYSVVETWILSTEAAIEDFTVTTRTSSQEGLTSVGIEGSVVGLETNTYPYAVSTSKYSAASTKWTSVESALLTRAQSYSGITLNIDPATISVGKNPVAGVINYSYEYNNRPSNCITDALSEVITITDVGQGDVFAVIPIPGRAAGPILQDICTVTEKRRQLNIEVIMPVVDSCDFAEWMAGKPSVTTIVDAVEPTGTKVFGGPPTETWVPNTGRYSYSREWTYED